MRFAYYGRREPREELLEELLLSTKLIAIDVETVSLEVQEPIGMAIATSPDDAFYFPLVPMSSYVPWGLLRDPSITKIMHNSLADLEYLKEFAIDDSNIEDTLVMAHLLGLPGKLVYLGGEFYIEVIPIFHPPYQGLTTTLEIPTEVIAQRCCNHAMATYATYLRMEGVVDWDYYRTEMELVPILIAMSSRGIKIDQAKRTVLETKLGVELQSYIDIAEELGFNPGSPQQVAYMLSKEGVFLPLTKSKKSLSTAEEILNKLDSPMASMVLNYRKSKWLSSNIIKPLADQSRGYTRFHLDAITGRVSSKGMNMQNIPTGETRGIFLPDNDVLTDMDYSQIELRVLAELSQDRVMLDIFEAGGDIHQETADFMGVPRYYCKTVNFSMVYGATIETIAENAKVHKNKAKELLDMWSLKYYQAAEWIDWQQKQALKDGYITTLFGRRIKLPMDEREDAIKRKAVNYPIQGSAAEIVKRAMIRCAKTGLLDKMILQVHDELLFDGNVVMELDNLSLDRIASFRTPYEVKLLERWE